MIVANDRDRRAVEWLEARFSAEAIATAEKSLAGARKPYPSNIAKALGVSLPDSLKIADSGKALQKLAEIRQMLKGKGG